MPGPEAAGKASVFPRPVDVKPRIVTALIVSDPFIVGMNVRSFRMTRLIRE